VAFHLHRLKLVGRPLHATGYHKTDAADLAAGRVPLTAVAVAELAEALDIEPTELHRALTPSENRAWAFYRVSAADPSRVWKAARDAWIGRGLTDKDAAKVMGFTPKAIAETKLRPFALSFTAALALTTALKIPAGPEAFLPLPKRAKPERDR
jgi:hypothetical protein